MTPTVITLSVAAFWIVCGVLQYGLFLAHFQRTFRMIAWENRKTDVAFAIFGAVLGPIGLGATLASGFFRQGFLWKPLPYDPDA